MRVVIELKRDAMADVVLNQLYRFSTLQTTFGANMVALIGGRPEQLNLKDMIHAFIEFREEVIGRRTKFLLRKARDRAHVLVGLAIAVANIDEVIALIRTAPDPAAARERLMARDWPAKDVIPLVALVDDPRHKISAEGTYRLSEEQARAILDLRLQRLTALGRDEIGDELAKLGGEITDYLDILRSRARIIAIVKDELNAIKAQFATPRRTEILEMDAEVEDEDLIQREDMVVTVSHKGYIKRVPLSAYRAQRRGGKGRAGMATREEDFVTRIFVANTHTPVLFFSSRGMAYKMKVWRLPMAAPQARGKALINLLPLAKDENITTILPLPEDEASWDKLDVMFATTAAPSGATSSPISSRSGERQDRHEARRGRPHHRRGDLQRERRRAADHGGGAVHPLPGHRRARVQGPRIHRRARHQARRQGPGHLHGDPRPRRSSPCGTNGLCAPAQHQARWRRSRGGHGSRREWQRGSAVSPDRYAELSANEEFILTVSENGYGKRTSAYEYRITGRGGQGIIAMAVNQRNGRLVASFPVEDGDQIMLVTDRGQLIRVPVDGIRIVGRATQGVTCSGPQRTSVWSRSSTSPMSRTAMAMKDRRMKALPTTSRSTTVRSMKRSSSEEVLPVAAPVLVDFGERARRRREPRKSAEVAHQRPAPRRMPENSVTPQPRHDPRQSVCG